MAEDIDKYYADGLDKELGDILRAEAGQQGDENDAGQNNPDGGAVQREIPALGNSGDDGGNDNGID